MATLSSGALGAGVSAADERTRIAALLSRYPHNSAEELADIAHWFHYTASALDVGLLASEETIAEQYRAYRTEHYDRFGMKDFVRAGAFLGATAVFIGAILVLMPA